MRDMSQAVLGMLAALLSAVLVFGGLTISLAEGGLQAALAPQSSPTDTQPVPTQRPGEPTYTPSPTPPPTATPTRIISDICPYPPDWVEVVVDFGDDIASLSARYNISEAVLRQSNCLDMRALMAGMSVYVPPITPTFTSAPSDTPSIPPFKPEPTRVVACARPYGWVIYFVRRGDTLYSISTSRGISVQELKSRNCLSGNIIRVGQRLYVPNVPVLPPSSTPLPYLSPTPPPPQATWTSVPPTAAPPTVPPVVSTPTSIPPTATQVVLPTDTALPPTITETPSAPPPTPTAPSTPVPSSTPVPIPRTPEPLPSATDSVLPPPNITRPPLITLTGEAILITPSP